MEQTCESSPQATLRNATTTADYDLQLPAWSIDGLKTAAMQLSLPRPHSLAWAILLYAVPPPTADIMSSMRTHRNYYNDLRSKLSTNPSTVVGDDPLSQNDESVWKQHFCDNELKALILQDVVRTFPDEAFFRDKDIQDMMVRVLFLWARSHANVGYRQGMHEVLAPLLMELYQDRHYAPSTLSDSLKYYLDEESLEHDGFLLFSAVMKGLERFYTTGSVVPSACGRLPTSTSVHNPNEVVRYLERVREEYLERLDPELATHLADHNITMELFGIRWLRLLFGREFSRSELGSLWGLLFSEGPALPLLPHVLVALLIAVRPLLLEGDGGAALSCLMRPSQAPARHVCALALHLCNPTNVPRPAALTFTNKALNTSSSSTSSFTLEHVGSEGPGTDSGSEGVAEGADVARELAALALVRAQLPVAAAALARAIPKPPMEIAQPLQQILQLAALLQCRNHAIIDVETALEAAEGQNTDRVGRRQLVPVSMIGGKRTPVKQKPKPKPPIKLKEVQLKVFTQSEGPGKCGNLPNLDPLGLRTE